LTYSIEAAAGQRALRCLYYDFYAKGTTNYVTQMTIVSLARLDSNGSQGGP
jgi:hypothetical protein